MSAATWDQPIGTSASFISKTIEPSGLVIRESFVIHSTESRGSSPGLVKKRLIVSPLAPMWSSHPAGARDRPSHPLPPPRRFQFPLQPPATGGSGVIHSPYILWFSVLRTTTGCGRTHQCNYTHVVPSSTARIGGKCGFRPGGSWPGTCSTAPAARRSRRRGREISRSRPFVTGRSAPATRSPVGATCRRRHFAAHA